MAVMTDREISGVIMRHSIIENTAIQSFFSYKGITAVMLMLLTNFAVQLPAVVSVSITESFAPELVIFKAGLIFFGTAYLSGLTFSNLLNILREK